MTSEPRLVQIDPDKFQVGGGRYLRWSCVPLGTGLAQVRRLTRANAAELRYLTSKGAVKFDPPLPPSRRYKSRSEPGRQPVPDTTRYPPLPPVETTPRECMTCGVTFLSEGNHHRLCKQHRRESGETVYGVNAPFNPD